MGRKTILCSVAAFVAGVGLAVSLHAMAVPTFKGLAPAAAADALLVEAQVAAGKGSWEQIAVGAAYYEGLADKSKGQAIFDALTGPKAVASDLQRIARLHAEMGEWAKAKALYDRAITLKPKDAVLLAETGAYYNLNGDRDTAEALFTRSFAAEANNPWTYSIAAASYLGKKPRTW